MDLLLEARNNDGTFKATHFDRFSNRNNGHFFYCKFIRPSSVPLGTHHQEPSQGKNFKNKVPYPNQEACERGLYLSFNCLPLNFL